MDAGGGPHTYVDAVSPSASATVSYLWAWHAKTAGKWMPRAAQIKSRHYKYESEQLAGRSLWSCGGRDDGSKLGGKLSERGPSSAVLTVGSACIFAVRVADLRSRHGQYLRPQPHSTQPGRASSRFPTTQRTSLLAKDGADADGPPRSKSGVLITSRRTSAGTPSVQLDLLPPTTATRHLPRCNSNAIPSFSSEQHSLFRCIRERPSAGAEATLQEFVAVQGLRHTRWSFFFPFTSHNE